MLLQFKKDETSVLLELILSPGWVTQMYVSMVIFCRMHSSPRVLLHKTHVTHSVKQKHSHEGYWYIDDSFYYAKKYLYI